MVEAKTRRNGALIVAAIFLFIAAAINLMAGIQTFSDRPSIIEEGAVPAAVTYWGLSSLAFGLLQAIGAILLLQHKREGEAVSYTMIVLAAVYWISTFSVRPAYSAVALAALLLTTILIVANRADLT